MNEVSFDVCKMDQWMKEWMDKWMDGLMDGLKNRLLPSPSAGEVGTTWSQKEYVFISSYKRW